MSLSIKGLFFLVIVFFTFKATEAFMVYEQGIQLHNDQMEFIKKAEERLWKTKGKTE
ncbi:hypothetical protein [Terasakiella sp. SH-1]|uniref:hypothetical protein n=1 Tax=Terasakiella sp. SH-1 TaxID=2560057 RepID=UPI0014314376|nr:hypothetical protein [Terasakiella sp. SH-1]